MYKPTKKVSLYTFFTFLICGNLLIFSCFFIYQADKAISSSIVESANTSINYISKVIEHNLNTRMSISETHLRLLENTGIGLAKNTQERMKILPILANMLRGNPTAESIYVGYSTGEFFFFRRSSDILKKQKPDLPSNSEFFIVSYHTDLKGEVQSKAWSIDKTLKQTIELHTNTHHLPAYQRIWYTLAQNSDDVISTPAYVFHSSGELGITMAKKINEGSAVIGIDILMDELQASLQSLRPTPNSEIAIIDEKGQLAAYTKNYESSFSTESTENLSSVSQLEMSLFNEFLKGNFPENKVIRHKTDSINWYGLSTWVGENYKSPLRLLIGIPESELFYEAREKLVGQVINIGIIFTAMILIVFMLSQSSLRPLQFVIAHLIRLSHFNFSKPLRLFSRFSEIQEIENTLNQMTRSLSAFQEIIRLLNQEKDQATVFQSVLSQILSILKLKEGYMYIRRDSELELFSCKGEAAKNSIIQLPQDILSDDETRALISEKIGKKVLTVLLYSSTRRFLGTLSVDPGENCPPEEEIRLFAYLSNIAQAAAIGIETQNLIASQKALLDSMIELIASAIDAKSQHTAGHCKRVPKLSLMLLEELRLSKDADFKDFDPSPEQIEAFRIAAWLHDCGKLTTPEYIVDKATKLEAITNRIHEIRTRFEVILRDAYIEYLESVAKGADPNTALTRYQETELILQEEFKFVAQCNIGSESMKTADIERLHAIASRTWLRHFDNRLGLSREEFLRYNMEQNIHLPITEYLLADKVSHIIPWKNDMPYVDKNDPRNTLGFDMTIPKHKFNYGELYNLCIPYGTLTTEERFKINDHIVQTIIMLNRLPWPKNLKEIPDIAGNHHETIQGTGYPRKLPGEKLSIEARIIAIADVFEALTAPDRPYKEGKKLTEALAILTKMAQKGALDKSILRLFLRSGIYEKYAETYINKDQIDPIDISVYLNQIKS